MSNDAGSESAKQSEEASAPTKQGSSVSLKPVEWLVPGWITQHGLNLISGTAGTGKSQVALDMIARLTKGKAFPDQASPEESKICLVAQADDDESDTVVPRLRALGAKLDSVHFINQNQVGLPAISELGIWSRLLQASSPKLLLLDPIDAFIGGCDERRSDSVRKILQPFLDLLDSHGVALLGTGYPRSHVHADMNAAKIVDRLLYSSLARTIQVLLHEKSQKGKRILRQLKNYSFPTRPDLLFEIKVAVLHFQPKDYHESLRIDTSCVSYETEKTMPNNS